MASWVVQGGKKPRLTARSVRKKRWVMKLKLPQSLLPSAAPSGGERRVTSPVLE
jgi:hypothetical protein